MNALDVMSVDVVAAKENATELREPVVTVEEERQIATRRRGGGS